MLEFEQQAETATYEDVGGDAADIMVAVQKIRAKSPARTRQR